MLRTPPVDRGWRKTRVLFLPARPSPLLGDRIHGRHFHSSSSSRCKTFSRGRHNAQQIIRKRITFVSFFGKPHVSKMEKWDIFQQSRPLGNTPLHFSLGGSRGSVPGQGPGSGHSGHHWTPPSWHMAQVPDLLSRGGRAGGHPGGGKAWVMSAV